MEKMKVVQVPVKDLRPYDNNAKRHTREQIDAVVNSIREFGFRNPIIAWHDEDGVPVIVAGHARAKAAQEIGMETVPVVFCDDLDDASRRALTLVDNQTTMMTGWDEDMLAYELDTLSDCFDMTDFGFDSADTDAVDLSAIDEDEVPETVECRCKPGDVWVLGGHRIMCGSATDADDVEKLVGGGSSHCC
jgi:ParB-like chromosome segregation protein Spo0J